MEPRFSYEAFPPDRPERKWSRWRCTPGVGGEFIEHLPSLLERKGQPLIVLLCRVSSKEQEQAGNLDVQRRYAIKCLQEKGYRRGRDLFVVEGVESSRIQDDRHLLFLAVEEARKCGGIVVAVSRDRLIRSRSFDGSNVTEPPTISEYLQLKSLAGVVPLATIMHPDDPAARSDQIKRGQTAKGRKGGRPRKRKWKERRLAWIGLAMKMRDEGQSYQQIADSLNAMDDGFCNVTKKTVWNWLQRGV